MTDINVGAITEALNDKTDRDLQNVDNTAGADAVIAFQRPTAENGYTWFRKYASGWVEQGGYITTVPASEESTVIFPVAMADTNYFATKTIEGYVSSTGWISYCGANIYDKATGSMKIRHGTAASWEVKGMAA